MHDSLHISAYTPSNTDPEILEKMFVQRTRLLERAVAWCEESITTKKKNHLLFVGPRGSGKTHFIAMVVNRLKDKARTEKSLKKNMIIVWLGEDDVITNFIDLVLSILETLVRSDPKQFNKNCLKLAKEEKPDKAAEIILQSITQQIGSRTILLVKENMSDVFAGLKDAGQKKFRAYLQENRNIAILATSQQLFEGVSSRDAAFFGFFDTFHLEVLGVDDAKQLISNIAELNGIQDLVDFLKTPQGCYRIRALHHLAGGNHRLYVELAAFLTMESLDDFVSALSKLADNLTPYFQERVKSLPPQQGKIVQKLCELQGATPVKIIAEVTFIGERSVAKQLGDLARKGYVVSHKRGKQSYYEMAEPLMRLSLEVKNNHGKPLKMVASLLRVWFSDSELLADDGDCLFVDYKQAALEIGDEILTTLNNQIMNQVSEARNSCNYSKVISVSNEILGTPKTSKLLGVEKAQALSSRGLAYYMKNSIEQSVLDFSDVISLNKKGLLTTKKIDIAGTLLLRAMGYMILKKYDLALDDLKSALKEKSISPHVKEAAAALIPEVYFILLEVNQAQKTMEDVLNIKLNHYPARINHILKAISQLGSSSWEAQIIWILPLFDKYKVLNSLGSALIHSISPFIDDKSLKSSFPKWQKLWQKHAKQYQEMQLPLQALEAAMNAVEQKNDKPLLALPKEVRELVMPLVAKSFTA